jgi:hypothetical protein
MFVIQSLVLEFNPIMWKALSNERAGISGPNPARLMTIFYYLTVETPPSWRARSPKNTVARLYPQALGSLFFASYVSQGYGGGIRTHLHKVLKSLSWPRHRLLHNSRHKQHLDPKYLHQGKSRSSKTLP